ncbi:MAG: nuclear transport factor 2 family protein, partial [Gammaproteobacteria bacterium]|nr:nuclear transport factor 2 family protein [Gammaproteobacteria bacterium]
DYYESWSASIKAGAGVDKYELSDVQIQVLPGGEAAVSSYFVVGTSHTADGVSSTVNAFESEVWQKIDGEWKIISLHYTEF